MGVHSKASAFGARGSAQLHIHHMHVLEAGASRVVSPAGLAPAQTPAQLRSPEIGHKHSDHTVEAQAGGGQGSGSHGIGVSGGKGAEPADRAFIEHSARPSAVRRSQGSLKPEAIRVCGHGDTEALEVRARVGGTGGLCWPPPVPREPSRPSPGGPRLRPIWRCPQCPRGPPGPRTQRGPSNARPPGAAALWPGQPGLRGIPPGADEGREGLRSGDGSYFRVGWCQGGRHRAHQEIGIAQDFCPRFVDYFGMGHFHHKVRVPGRGERGSEDLEEVLDLPSPDSQSLWRPVTLRPGLGREIRQRLVLFHIWVNQGPERVRESHESTQHLREARTGASESPILSQRGH